MDASVPIFKRTLGPLGLDMSELLKAALRVCQGRAFYDGTGGLERPVLDRLSRWYGLIVL